MDKGAKWEAPMIEERCKHLRTAISDWESFFENQKNFKNTIIHCIMTFWSIIGHLCESDPIL
jgi:hypothetical protein